MAKCQLCGKVSHTGNNVSHSKRRTKTRWYPNVQRVRLTIDGKRQRVSLCTRCLRSHQNVELRT